MMLVLLLTVAFSSLVHSAPVFNSSLPLDCEDVYNLKKSLKANASVPNGVYTIYPAGPNKPVKVYCDMGCVDGDGHSDEKWTVIQRRIDGNVSFYRPWEQYKEGFGDASGEYWLGLENMFLLTYREKYQLRVDMEDFERGSAYAQYSLFYIDPESSSYRLNIGGYVNGGAGGVLSSATVWKFDVTTICHGLWSYALSFPGDSLTYVNGRNFGTFDRDVTGSCAESYGGGFWYNWWTCHLANPNGLYKYRNTGSAYVGITWQSWKGYYYSMKSISMKIRRMSLEDLEEL